MLVVKVELWPGGDERRAEVIGRMTISNVGTHPDHPKRGNYVARLMRKGTERTVQRAAEVLDYPRLHYPVWKLVKRALEALYDH
jgi:hypothetical protein